MESCLYLGRVWHRRRRPRHHEFTYPAYVFWLALDELPALSKQLSLWSWNRPNIFSFRDRDHLDGREGSVDVKIRRLLADHHVALDGGRIFLVTQCRVLGYVFNPVSFYFCYGHDGALAFVAAEVNNTFGERHIYLLEERAGGGAIRRFAARKDMHVSPFVSMDAEYDFRIAPVDESLSVTILEREEGMPVLDARVWGRRVPLTDVTLWSIAWRYPLITAGVVAAIHWQALRLWRKGIGFRRQPRPSRAQLEQQAQMRRWPESTEQPPSMKATR